MVGVQFCCWIYLLLLEFLSSIQVGNKRDLKDERQACRYHHSVTLSGATAHVCSVYFVFAGQVSFLEASRFAQEKAGHTVSALPMSA